MFSDVVYKWLESALDYGISEREFWDMSIAELIRAIESKRRLQLLNAKERASFDYILADLIGRSVARIHSSANHLPPLFEVYPTLFKDEELSDEIQEKRDELSVLRFKQFANAFNKKFKREDVEIDQ